jgi:hypothetical protein
MDRCTYCRLFRIPPQQVRDAQGRTRQQQVAPAFLVESDEMPHKGEKLLSLRMMLFQSDPRNIPDLLDAFFRVGNPPDGRPARLGQFTYQLVSPPLAGHFQRDDLAAMAARFQGCRKVRIVYETPAAITLRQQRRCGLTFAEIIGAIIDRLHHGLAWHWRDTEISARCAAMRAQCVSLADEIMCTASEVAMVHEERRRYHDSPQEISGFTGFQDFAGALDPFWPLLIAATLMHLGNNTMFDRGRLSFRAWKE